jgi:hypothetical protein
MAMPIGDLTAARIQQQIKQAGEGADGRRLPTSLPHRSIYSSAD